MPDKKVFFVLYSDKNENIIFFSGLVLILTIFSIFPAADIRKLLLNRDHKEKKLISHSSFARHEFKGYRCELLMAHLYEE